MKLQLYNVNEINGRLSVLLRWLEKSEPDVAWLHLNITELQQRS
jgi:hypothetical protein